MNTGYNIFISWSKQRSLWIANALKTWLPVVLQSARPWMSDSDVQKGSRSLNEIALGLEGIKVGIICLTPENLSEPWILYEAGTLSKALDDRTRLCTYLLGGLQFQDINPPLGMFQATKAEKDDTRKLIHAVNSAISDNPVPEQNLNQIFDAMWPMLHEKLQAMPEADENVIAKRSPEEMITEILEIVRAEANRRRKSEPLDAFVPLFDELVPVLPNIREALRNLKNQILTASLSGTSSGASSVSGNLTGASPTGDKNASVPNPETVDE